MHEEPALAASDLEALCVDEALRGTLVLCAQGRSARRVLHLLRMRQAAAGRSGWPSPPIYGLNRWVRERHALLWERARPQSKAAAMRLWSEAARSAGPPEGLDLSPGLCLQLQRSFDQLQRVGLDPAAGGGGGLPGWRARASAAYLRGVRTAGVAPWADIMQAVARAVSEGRIALPERVLLAGFGAPTAPERGLFAAMEGRARVTLASSTRPLEAGARVRVYASPEQECLAVCDEVLREWNGGRRNLAVAFLEPSYGTILRTTLDGLAAREPLPRDALRYNVAAGTPLTEHPLYRSLLLPLRIIGDPDPGPLLVSLLLSPYVRSTAALWTRDAVQLLWSPAPSTDLAGTVRALAAAGFGLGGVADLAKGGERRLEAWLSGLETAWDDLGVLRFEGENVRVTDALAFKHLADALQDLRAQAGGLRMGPAEALAWIAAAAEGLQVVEKTPETAGIQILPAPEAAGLSFDRLWVVGCHGRALPRPAEDLPLLSPEERASLEEASPEGQWAIAVRELECLAACSRELLLSRAARADDDSPFLPCPFVPDEEAEGGRTVDPWSQSGAWRRMPWLSAAFRGLTTPRPPSELAAEERVAAALPERFTVTGDLQTLMQCPYRFLCARLVRLEGLPDRGDGIAPEVRGDVIHRIAAAVTERLAGVAGGWEKDLPAAMALLERTADEVLHREVPGWQRSPFWRVERARLLGAENFRGVLTAWLEAEARRAAEGWRFAGAELKLDDLDLPSAGIRLKGRLDRVDGHEALGWAVWDYKTGVAPKPAGVTDDMAFPQIPAYAAALREPSVREKLRKGDGEPPADDAPIAGGYIPLKRASAVTVEPLKEGPRAKAPLDLRSFLPRWEEAVASRLAGPRGGRFPADPKPGERATGHPCDNCEFDHLCGRFDVPEGPGDEEDEA